MPNTKSQMGPKTERTPERWYEAKMGNDHQGLIIDELTGENIAVTYKKENAAFVVKACNHFEEMRTAIKNLAVCMENEPEGFHPAWIAQIKRLIAKIEGA